MILPLGDEQIAHGFDKGRAHHQAGVLAVRSYGRSHRAVRPAYCSIFVAMQLYKHSSGYCVDLAQIGLASWLS
jgi:hypothetical protein